MYNTNALLIQILFFLNTLIGGVFTFIHLRSKPTEKKKQIWIKFIVFFIINLIVIYLLKWNHFWFIIIFTGVLLIGLYEITYNGFRHFKILAVGLALYILISYLFINFLINTSAFGILIIYVFAITFDGFSQAAGQLVGKFKFVTKVSPNKTIEGLLGGLLFVLINYCIIFFNQIHFSSILTTLLIVLSYQLGDLMFSFYKRKVLIKDYSKLIPGHGGVLDRFDSFIVAGCIAYLLKLYNYEI